MSSAVLPKLDESALAILFTSARTSRSWLDEAVPESLLRELYDLVALAPTSANLSHGRFVFVVSKHAKERLIPALSAGNVDKTRTAPVTVIVAYDTEFYNHAGKLFPMMDVKPMFEGHPDTVKQHGEQNANLQAAYIIVAARALGLAAGPMAGFNASAVDQEFFPDGKWKSILLINLGYPDLSEMPPRLPRLAFDEAATIL